MRTTIEKEPLNSDLAIDEIEVSTRFDRRLVKGMRSGRNWLQLLHFGLVGASGFVVNLVVFWLLTEVLHLYYGVSAVVAFVVALTNNFIWNRKFTFAATAGHAGFQAARFVTVSVIAFLFSFGILNALVFAFQTPRVLAQAVSLVFATPLNFLGNRLWSFAIKSV